jgi:hypothetical protein
MNNVKTAERMIKRNRGELIDIPRAVRKCEEVADAQAKALQKVMRCYDPKRCAMTRCGECGR